MSGTKLLVLGWLLVAGQAGAWTREEIFRELEPRIAGCIGRKDTAHPLFHGCIDWHSAVHGHWALFRIARATGTNTAFTRQAERALDDRRLSLESADLARRLEFENPYGRAWFLRLAIDFEKWASKTEPRPARLRAMADLVGKSILQYFSQRPITPASHEYQNASWAFYQLHAYYDFVGDSAGRATVESIIESHFLGDKPALTLGQDKNEFFSLYGNWVYLVAKTMSSAVLTDFLSVHPVDSAALAPISVTSAHSMGLNWSRAWTFSALFRKTADSSFSSAFQSHVARGMQDHLRYRDDYYAYGHWVPQFAVYALSESLD
jgi:hypothetical protein